MFTNLRLVLDFGLLRKHIAAGFSVYQDDHVVELRHGEKTVARWPAATVTVAQILHEADQALNSLKSGIEFIRISADSSQQKGG